MNFERLIRSLPLEMMGNRLVFIALTYPGDWRRWVPDGRALEGHRRKMVERMRRRWGVEPVVGLWCKEFQKRGAPHFHLYVGLPDSVSGEDYEGFRQRTLLRKRLEAKWGIREGRKKLPAIGEQYGGETAMWLRDAWSGVVGTYGVERQHHARGVDVAVSFWSEEVAASKSRVEVAGYMAGEMAKWRQKAPPEGFSGVGDYYGSLGRQVGFVPQVEMMRLPEDVGVWVTRVMARYVRLRMAAKRRGWSRDVVGEAELVKVVAASGMARRRERDGVTAFGFGAGALARVIRFAEGQVARGRRFEYKRPVQHVCFSGCDHFEEAGLWEPCERCGVPLGYCRCRS